MLDGALPSDRSQRSRAGFSLRFTESLRMKGVIVVRTTWPIDVLIGFGKPVVTTLPFSGLPFVLGDGKDLQLMMLTTWQGEFLGHTFLKELYRGTSTGVMEWWRHNNPVLARRPPSPTPGLIRPSGILRP